MKLWIPGAQGVVGRALQKKCLEAGISYIPSGHNEVDIGSLYEVKQFFHQHPDITHIVNCAAYTNVDNAEKECEEAYKANTLGPENLGKLAQQEGINIVHISTDYVFDYEHPHPLSEEAPCAPLSVYAKTKKEGEERLVCECPKACIVRTSWVFGEGGKNFISSLRGKFEKEKKVAVVFDQVNRLTYAPDLAAALLTLLCHDGIYHFANHGVVSRYDVAQKMHELLKAKGKQLVCEEIVKVSSSEFSPPAKRPRYSVLDTRKIENIMNTTPRTWDAALTEYIHEIH